MVAILKNASKYLDSQNLQLVNAFLLILIWCQYDSLSYRYGQIWEIHDEKWPMVAILKESLMHLDSQYLELVNMLLLVLNLCQYDPLSHRYGEDCDTGRHDGGKTIISLTIFSGIYCKTGNFHVGLILAYLVT